MRAAFRAAAMLATLAGIYLAGAAGVRAADPSPSPAIGGVLDAKPGVVTVSSMSTMPVIVTLTPDGPFTLESAELALAPGESRQVAVVGESAGEVSARFAPVEAGAGDSSTVTLSVAFPKSARVNLASIGLSILAVVVGLAGLAYGVRSTTRRWTFRVERRR